jgi:thiamine monophosphate kinase
VAAAVTGTPVWGMATIAADQMFDVPKLKDIPKSIRELAKENEKVKKSPVGLLFNIHKKNA